MKHTYKHTKPQPSWLLQGLMIRAGLYDPLPPVPPIKINSDSFPFNQADGGKSWLQRAWAKAKAAFVYDPDRT